MTFKVTISTRAALVLLVLAVLAIPATALATHVFLDVSDQSVHFPGIQFMKNSGVSVGCQDGSVYCPDDFVTRAQMGTFMYRLSGNDPATDPSVNADAVDGVDGPLFASIAGGSGALLSGNAVSSERITTGSYRVTFARNTTGCAATAASGLALGIEGGSGAVHRMMPTVSTGESVPGRVAISWRNSITQNQEDTDFHLIVVCPSA